jgi:pimeloyl-ACP methyl ester carboxylesterase
MAAPTRPLPPLKPLPDGGWMATSSLSSPQFTVHGKASEPSNSVVPIIVVPGIMGSNLKAKSHPRNGGDRNHEVDPGEAAWRPPNGKASGLWDSFAWDRRTPKQRQQLLDPDTLEVDDRGPVHVAHGPQRGHAPADLREVSEVRQRWWGEVHADSYSGLLCALQTRLNRTFYKDWHGHRQLHTHWQDVIACDPKRWGLRQIEALTEAELEKHAHHHFPVYACGYNWLESCEQSSRRLEQRITEIIDTWRGMKRKCDQVILVTHSMGGLVARACARRIPDKIAGVVHGVMPALGSPAAYRRLACGTESPDSIRSLPDFVKSRIAKVLGPSTRHTTPVLAVSPGALELLPTHLYPGPWLHISVLQPNYPKVSVREQPLDCLHLPNERQPSPYALYRDLQSWYRLVDPELADPAEKHRDKKGGVESAIIRAVLSAERFHTEHLGDYYHPNTHAFYSADPEHLSFGEVRWIGKKDTGLSTVLTPANVSAATPSVTYAGGLRRVRVDPECTLMFEPAPPDTSGDGTVPHQSGAGPTGKTKGLFETRGYDHQGSFNDEAMQMLTLHLIAKITQRLN